MSATGIAATTGTGVPFGVSTVQVQASDIHAAGAFNGTSWTPEAREKSVIEDYLSFMQTVIQELSQWRDAENAIQMDEDLEDFRQRYAAKYNAYLSAHSRVISQFITGSGGWTPQMVRRNEARNETVDKRRRELTEYAERQLGRLRLRYNPRARSRAPISSDDPNAVERIEDKIEALEARQATMKAANLIVRSPKLSQEEKLEALTELEYVDEETARRLLRPDPYQGHLGYPSYVLTNNGANIRRLRERVVELKAKAERAARIGHDIEERHGDITYRESFSKNRVQLLFPGKPSERIRRELKSYGFHWSPTECAWQRQLTTAARHSAKNILKLIADGVS